MWRYPWNGSRVLILVVVEDGLVLMLIEAIKIIVKVLILVVVEDGLVLADEEGNYSEGEVS